MIPTGENLIETILDARRPEEVFDGSRGDDYLRTQYRMYARFVHPDVNDDKRADAAFAKLTKLYQAGRRALKNGTYGTTMAPPVDPITVRTKRHAYKVTEGVVAGDTSNIYRAEYEGESGPRSALIKVVRDRRDNDLARNEAKVLKTLLSDPDTYDLAAPYLPSYIETFGYRTRSQRQPRQALAFTEVPNLYTLGEVRSRYPNGVHPKDAAWMVRRILMGIGMAHAAGIVHGAVLPEHVLIEPDLHGLVLIDWKYAVEDGDTIKAISKPRESWYPPEVMDKRAASAGTDVYMAMCCMQWVMGGFEKMPTPMRSFFKGSMMGNPKRRPAAWDLKEEFDDLIEDLWGKRRFQPFSMA